jgi:hypothetical protein
MGSEMLTTPVERRIHDAANSAAPREDLLYSGCG